MKRHAKVQIVSEREYRDKLNGILRDADGKITHIYGKSVVKEETEEEVKD